MRIYSYILFPIMSMYYFGTNLDNRFAVPDFWPKPEQTHKIPYEREEIKHEVERMKQRRLEMKKIRDEMRERQAAAGGGGGREGGVTGQGDDEMRS